MLPTQTQHPCHATIRRYPERIERAPEIVRTEHADTKRSADSRDNAETCDARDTDAGNPSHSPRGITQNIVVPHPGGQER